MQWYSLFIAAPQKRGAVKASVVVCGKNDKELCTLDMQPTIVLLAKRGPPTNLQKQEEKYKSLALYIAVHQAYLKKNLSK